MKTKKIKEARLAKDYSSRYYDTHHIPIRTFEQAFNKKYQYNVMALFHKKEYVGEGSFELVSKRLKHIHTDGVALDRKKRKQGHGIHLYFHLIETARKLGAKRIYSSTNLNKNSRPMWDKKLPNFYNVKRIYQRGPCSGCGCSCKKRVKKFYIDLE